MCGIFGIIDQQNKPIPRSLIEKACESIAHRGPDGQGVFEGRYWAFGHRRLAILDLSRKGHQPMKYRNKVLTFNGEIYNYIELRTELEKEGYHFESNTDTEVLLAAYCHWGKSCLDRFNGMWAFAIYDETNNEIFCARDRFGIKPFYYTQFQHQFCFASEIKQFTTLPFWQAKLNTARAWDFLVNGYHDHTQETFFKDVLQLPPGTSLSYNLNTHRYSIQPFYQLKSSAINPLNISLETASQQFCTLFEDAVRIRLRSDVKVGTALSGGLDSSSIVGMIHQLLEGGKQMSISACFDEAAINEQPYIDAVVKHTGLEARKVFPTFEGLKSIYDTILWHQDEPVAGAGIFAQQQVFKTARANGISVMLDGQGADEILGGYEKFYLPMLKQQLRKNPFTALGNIIQFFRIHQTGANEAIQTAKGFFKKLNTKQVDWLNINTNPQQFNHFKRQAESSILDTSINALYGVGLPILLHYEDRNSMAASVESRLPFLDYRLVEFCLSLPDELKIHKAIRKYILRESMKPLLPKKVYQRYDKLGYATPQSTWMKTHHSYFQKELKEAIQYTQGFIQIEKLPDDLNLIWRVISLGRWMKLFDVRLD